MQFTSVQVVTKDMEKPGTDWDPKSGAAARPQDRTFLKFWSQEEVQGSTA